MARQKYGSYGLDALPADRQTLQRVYKVCNHLAAQKAKCNTNKVLWSIRERCIVHAKYL